MAGRVITLQERVRSFSRWQEAPAWAVGVFTADRVQWQHHEGFASLAPREVIDASARFRWFSVTKLLTALAAMKLIESKEVSTETSASSVLPWFQVAGGEGITVGQLLSHSSGLPNPSPVRWVHPPSRGAFDEVPSPGELTRRLVRGTKLRSEPGSQAHYTNLGYLVLGELIREVSGLPFAHFVRDELLCPLAMNETSFDPPAEVRGHERSWSLRAPVMALIFGHRTPHLISYVRDGFVGLSAFRLAGEAYGGLAGPLHDLMAFGRFFLGAGPEGVLQDESVATMMRVHAQGAGQAYGLGFHCDPKWVYHGGSAGGFRAELHLRRDRSSGFAVVANSGDAPAAELAAHLRACSGPQLS